MPALTGGHSGEKPRSPGHDCRHGTEVPLGGFWLYASRNKNNALPAGQPEATQAAGQAC
jgi:hypothetical protein